MRTIEKISMWVRHLPNLERADWLWDAVRPVYQRTLNYFGRNGLVRIINGLDRILISPRARGVTERYEPDVWRALMAELRTGDTFVDVGSFIGLYTVAVALRLRGAGRVIAFEPDSHNFSLLREHIKLNGLEKQVELHQAAVSDKGGRSHFLADGSLQARLVPSSGKQTKIIDVVTLDGCLRDKPIDLLKIDVEGHEEMVLRGAHNLLCTSGRKPRAIFIEVHPYAWASPRTGDSLLRLLNEAGYCVQTLGGEPIRSIECYGEIVARSES